MDATEAAARLGIHARTLRTYIDTGVLPERALRKVGQRRVYRFDDEWLALALEWRRLNGLTPMARLLLEVGARFGISLDAIASSAGVSASKLEAWARASSKPAGPDELKLLSYLARHLPQMGRDRDVAVQDLVHLVSQAVERPADDLEWRTEAIRISREVDLPVSVRVTLLKKAHNYEAVELTPDASESYREMLADENISVDDRLGMIDVSYGEFSATRRDLLARALVDDSCSPEVRIAAALEIAGAEGLAVMIRLAASADQITRERALSGLDRLSHFSGVSGEIRLAALAASLHQDVHVGRVFVSYVSEDRASVQDLLIELRRRGVSLWVDYEQLEPGSRWRPDIRDAIRSGDAFLAVFSRNSELKSRSHMRDELLVAVEELRLRPRDRTWFFPVRLNDCAVPSLPIGADETLRDLQWVDLDADGAVSRLARALNAATVRVDPNQSPTSPT